MMKNILFTLTILLFATGCLMAQEITNPELKKFVNELKASKLGSRNESKDEEKGFYVINSADEKSYKALSAIIEKYDIYFAEEIFGMELMLNVREGGSQTIMFQGDTYGMGIIDDAHSLDLVIIIVKGPVTKLFFEMRETPVVEKNTTEVYFNSNDGDAYIDSPNDYIVFNSGEIENVERVLPGDITLELFDHYMPMIQELEKKNDSAGADSIRQVWKDEILYLSSWLEKIESPGRIKIPCTGNFMMVIPKGTKQGLYEWINSTGICRTEGQKSNFIPATEIATFLATKTKQLQTNWSLEGYSDAMKEFFANEVPGGEPAYIYRRSTTDEGYETMLSDLQQFFYLDGKDRAHRYKGFKAIERIDTDEYRFLHLYGDNTTILIYDSKAERYCQMDIIVGGVETFNDAVNDISIERDNGYATKCNVIIRDGGVEFIEGEVEINGVTFDCGVHFTTSYMRNLK